MRRIFMGNSVMSVCLLLLLFSGTAKAHELQPGYLELRLVSPETYAVTWKVPAMKGRPMAISAKLPDNCTPQYAEQLVWDGAAYIARWQMTCPGGLPGGVIRIDGLEKTSTDVLVRVEYEDGTQESRRLTPNNPEFVVPTTPDSLAVARTYLFLGVEHILSGFDHLMFVLALVLLVRGVRRVIGTVTAFTVAHSLTLAAATLGWVKLSGPAVEATIALSIVFIAVEIRRSQQGETGWTEKYPWVVAFTFGLLHGFGFAGALIELGLPQKSIPLALLLFNVGVELGQLAFVMAVGVVVGGSAWLLRALRWQWPAWVQIVPPYAIGITAVYWVFQRVLLV